MKKATTPTSHVLVKATTNNDFDSCDFLLIHITDQWKAAMQKRLDFALQFKHDHDFNCLSYWECPLGFFEDPDQEILALLPPDEDWTFVHLFEDETNSFYQPANSLNAHQLIIYATGSAYYKAHAKHSGEAYWSENFDVAQILGIC